VAEYGVRTIVDLRGEHERADDPPAELPLEVLHVPFSEANEQELAELEAELEEAQRSAPDDVTARRDVYLVFVEHFKENVAAGVRAVARAPEGGVVVHCVGGKDRTGVLSALLLHLAGVEDDQIGADYELSGERLQPRHEAWLANAETEDEKEQIHWMANTPALAMIGVLEELEHRYGSAEDFLRAGGLNEEDLSLARQRLRG